MRAWTREGTPPTPGFEQLAPPLATKRIVPAPAKGTVVRPRLVELLDRGMERPFTLVSAPAGSGKTELLAQWIESGRPPGPVAWVPLGRDDADPHRFWADAIASLGATHADLVPLAAPPRGELRPFLTSVINTLSGVDETLVLVLDDLHLVGTPKIVRDLEWVLENAPANLRLVAATRSDPLFRLQRLRVAERMSEVRAADLAFTREEAVALLGPVDLPAEDVDRLWRRTEGWAAGLKLARLSLEGHADPRAFVAGFAGGDSAVSDYLISEVVARQPAETLAFMLRTSVAERVNGELAEALTGAASGSHTLRELARRDAFVSATGEEAGWYRYHRLFADVLRAELASPAAGGGAAAPPDRGSMACAPRQAAGRGAPRGGGGRLGARSRGRGRALARVRSARRRHRAPRAGRAHPRRGRPLARRAGAGHGRPPARAGRPRGSGRAADRRAYARARTCRSRGGAASP